MPKGVEIGESKQGDHGDVKDIRPTSFKDIEFEEMEENDVV